MVQERVDPVYLPFIKRIVDICLTDIILPFDARYPWQRSLATRKWSKLIEMKRFAKIKQRANYIYEYLERNLLYIPVVTATAMDGLLLSWKEDNRQVAFGISEEKLGYVFSVDGKESPVIPFPLDHLMWDQVMECLVHFLNGDCNLEFISESEVRVHTSNESVDEGGDRSSSLNGS